MRRCVIINPNAGSAGQVDQLIDRFGVAPQVEVFRTERSGDARRFAQLALRRGAARIIGAGGDGTLSDVLNGVAPDFKRTELAVIPLGTGNDLTRSLGIADDDLHAAVDRAMNGPARLIDVACVHNGQRHYFVNMASGGFGGEVAATMEQDDKRRWGPLAYWMTAMSRLSDLRDYHVHLELDDCAMNVSVYGLVVANGRFVAGGIEMAPAARLDDGLLDVTLVTVQPTIQMLAAGVEWILGHHDVGDRIMTFRARRVRLTAEPTMAFSVDGESMDCADVTFELLPSSLSIVVDPSAPALGYDE